MNDVRTDGNSGRIYGNGEYRAKGVAEQVKKDKKRAIKT
jgi:hypothetical protein